MVDLSVTLAPGLRLKNPIMTASGTFGYGREYQPYLQLDNLGAMITKGLSLRPKAGNDCPRIVETPCGMLNAIGLENIGADAFLRDELPTLRAARATVVVNIFGETRDDYLRLATMLNREEGIAALEINISCPNVKAGGIQFGTDSRMAAELVGAIREATSLPLITKLSPNVTDIVAIAREVAAAGSDCISLINTITGMAVDLKTKKPSLANVTGGLSGPAIKPVALRMVYQVAKEVEIPVIGIGGIATANDALEFLLVGASAIQVGTYNFINPGIATEIVAGLEAYLTAHGVASISDFIGSLEVPE
ncbi:MAG: dihydroorotate dehydrogenase [Deltaproteobacteria bacterium]|nr:dihydroorotate dehydrogenase [Candidatus Anaeroferrophillus wilburensis]MBN2888285.1 dihydroorotate dehydrogenase [Deltaproteobacteria bacterium]